jgi:flagellar protein FliS
MYCPLYDGISQEDEVMATRISNAYMLTKIMTATQQEVIVYLYEGAIGHIHRALKSIEDEHQEEASIAIEKTVSTLIELSGSLNYNSVDQCKLAVQLDGIYNYLIKSLTQAGARGDIEALESCEGILVILHDAWRQAVNLERSSEDMLELQPQVEDIGLMRNRWQRPVHPGS